MRSHELDDIICRALQLKLEELRQFRDSEDFLRARHFIIERTKNEINTITRFLALSRKERALELLSELIG